MFVTKITIVYELFCFISFEVLYIYFITIIYSYLLSCALYVDTLFCCFHTHSHSLSDIYGWMTISNKDKKPYTCTMVNLLIIKCKLARHLQHIVMSIFMNYFVIEENNFKLLASRIKSCKCPFGTI